MTVAKVALVELVSLGLGYCRRLLNRWAIARWPDPRGAIRSMSARSAGLATMGLATCGVLVVVAVLRAPAWSILAGAAPVIVIGETKVIRRSRSSSV